MAVGSLAAYYVALYLGLQRLGVVLMLLAIGSGIVWLRLRSSPTPVRVADVLQSTPKRECLVCRRVSIMRPMLRTNRAQIVLIVLLCFGILPGLVYLAWMWGKYRCDVCGAVGKNIVE